CSNSGLLMGIEERLGLADSSSRSACVLTPRWAHHTSNSVAEAQAIIQRHFAFGPRGSTVSGRQRTGVTAPSFIRPWGFRVAAMQRYRIAALFMAPPPAPWGGTRASAA